MRPGTGLRMGVETCRRHVSMVSRPGPSERCRGYKACDHNPSRVSISSGAPARGRTRWRPGYLGSRAMATHLGTDVAVEAMLAVLAEVTDSQNARRDSRSRCPEHLYAVVQLVCDEDLARRHRHTCGSPELPVTITLCAPCPKDRPCVGELLNAIVL